MRSRLLGCLLVLSLAAISQADSFPAHESGGTAPPALFSTGWESVSAGEGKLRIAQVSELRGQDGGPKAAVVAVRSRPLVCYPRGVLVDIVTTDGRRLTMLEAVGERVLLDGLAAPLHRFNSRIRPTFDSDAAVLEYLTLFGGGITADGGTFRVLHDTQMLTRIAERGGFDAPNRKVVPPRVTSRTDEQSEATAEILYGRSHFRSRFRIAPSGAVEMLDDVALASDLKVPVEKYAFSAAILKREGGAQPVAQATAKPAITPAPMVRPVPNVRPVSQRKVEPQETVEEMARRVAKVAGRKAVKAVGGGQDLVVDVRKVTYDRTEDLYEIDILISFNGAIVRTNNYRVAGRIFARRDGSGARFARTDASANYIEQLELFGGLKLLDEIMRELNK